MQQKIDCIACTQRYRAKIRVSEQEGQSKMNPRILSAFSTISSFSGTHVIIIYNRVSVVYHLEFYINSYFLFSSTAQKVDVKKFCIISLSLSFCRSCHILDNHELAEYKEWRGKKKYTNDAPRKIQLSFIFSKYRKKRE